MIRIGSSRRSEWGSATSQIASSGIRPFIALPGPQADHAGAERLSQIVGPQGTADGESKDGITDLQREILGGVDKFDS